MGQPGLSWEKIKEPKTTCIKTKKFHLTGIFLIAILLTFSLNLAARDDYQLKIYNLKDQAQPDVHDYLF
jgi:hypothetical protein